MEKGVAYDLGSLGGIANFSLDHIPDPDMCCAMCHGIPSCKAWIWRDAGLDGCPFACVVRDTVPTEAEKRAVRGRWTAHKHSDVVGHNMEVMNSTSVSLARKRAEEKGWSGFAMTDDGVAYFKAAQPGGGALTEADVVFKEGSNVTVHLYSEEQVVSGLPPPRPPLPSAPGRRDAGASAAGAASGRRGAPRAAQAEAKRESLFCFSLVMPFGYELGLLKELYRLEQSIFSCEAFAVYTNATLTVAPGLTTARVNSTLECGYGETAWNSWIFIAVWKKVIEDAVYKRHAWTVKADADAAFFPSRLRTVLVDHSGAGYLNNCKFGLHGPIEVLSRRAVDALAQDYAASDDGQKPDRCVRSLEFGIWGEDMFLDQCLSKVLNVTSEIDERLLCESHCECPDWYWCHNGSSRVSYHPFKRADMLLQCMANALGSDGAPQQVM